jgi:hypothetical protein
MTLSGVANLLPTKENLLLPENNHRTSSEVEPVSNPPVGQGKNEQPNTNNKSRTYFGVHPSGIIPMRDGSVTP